MLRMMVVCKWSSKVHARVGFKRVGVLTEIRLMGPDLVQGWACGTKVGMD